MRAQMLLLFLLPLSAAAFVAQPASVDDVQMIADPAHPQEYFGVLSGFPHTFEFSVGDAQTFSATLSLYGTEDAPAVLLLTKKEKRGVTEIGRTKGKGETWTAAPDRWLALPFREGGTLSAELESGAYRLEVSSPDNDVAYRLVIDGYGGGWYGTRLATLFSVYPLYGVPLYRALFSPLLYLPLLFIAGIGALLWYRRKRTR